MSPGQSLVAGLVELAICACLLGMVVRRRLAAAPWFAIYLALALAANRLIAWWPETFYTLAFWNSKESAYGILKVAIVFDLAGVAFAGWPRARRLARVGLAIAAVATLVLPAWLAAHSADADPALHGLAWVQAGAAWGFVALLAVARRYRLPLHGFHRSVVVGFVLYLGAYGAILDLMRRWPGHAALTALDPVAYAATACLWAIAAWQPEAASQPGAERRLLYPWLRT